MNASYTSLLTTHAHIMFLTNTTRIEMMFAVRKFASKMFALKMIADTMFGDVFAKKIFLVKIPNTKGDARNFSTES